jgi:hypothetical protein
MKIVKNVIKNELLVPKNLQIEPLVLPIENFLIKLDVKMVILNNKELYNVRFVT